MKGKIKDFVERGTKGYLYHIGNSRKIYYYFRYQKKVYRGSTKTEDVSGAENFIFDLIYNLSHNIAPEKTHKKNAITFNRVFDEFIQYKGDEGFIKEVTLDCYKKIGRFLVEYYSGKDIDDFREYGQEMYLQYQDWRRNYYKGKGTITHKYTTKTGRDVEGRDLTGKKVGNAALNKECIILHGMLTYAKRNKGYLKNWDIPKFSRVGNIKKEELPKLDIPILDHDKGIDEYQDIKDYYSERGNHFYVLYIRLLANTGMRVAEAGRVGLSDLKSDNKVFWIRGRKNQGSGELDTGFPMVGKVKQIIEDILAMTKEVRASAKEEYRGILLLNPDTGKPIGDIKKSFQKCVAAVIKRENRLTLGSCRHMYISKMVKQNIPLSLLARLVGHRTVSTIQKNYLSLRTQDLVDAVEDVYGQIAFNKEQKKKMGKIR